MTPREFMADDFCRDSAIAIYGRDLLSHRTFPPTITPKRADLACKRMLCAHKNDANKALAEAVDYLTYGFGFAG